MTAEKHQLSTHVQGFATVQAGYADLLAWATAAAARSKDLDILDGPVKG
jgi:hypothetical protein